MKLRLTWSRPSCFLSISRLCEFVAFVERVRHSRFFFFLIKGWTGELSGRERFTNVVTPSGSGDADRTLSLPAMLLNGYNFSWCSRPLSGCPCLGASTSQMDQADSPPARFYKEATGPESSEDALGMLVDDRCIDAGVFQPCFFVHELVFACSPPPPLPRSRVSHTILTEADWCSTRAVARCEMGLLPVIQTVATGFRVFWP